MADRRSEATKAAAAAGASGSTYGGTSPTLTTKSKAAAAVAAQQETKGLSQKELAEKYGGRYQEGNTIYTVNVDREEINSKGGRDINLIIPETLSLSDSAKARRVTQYKNEGATRTTSYEYDDRDWSYQPEKELKTKTQKAGENIFVEIPETLNLLEPDQRSPGEKYNYDLKIEEELWFKGGVESKKGGGKKDSVLLTPYVGGASILGTEAMVNIWKDVGFLSESKKEPELNLSVFGLTEEDIKKKGTGEIQVPGGVISIKEDERDYYVTYTGTPPTLTEQGQAFIKSIGVSKSKLAKGDVGGAAVDLAKGIYRGGFETGAFFASAGAGAAQIIKTGDLFAGEKILAESQRKSDKFFGIQSLGSSVLSGKVPESSAEYNIGQLVVPVRIATIGLGSFKKTPKIEPTKPSPTTVKISGGPSTPYPTGQKVVTPSVEIMGKTYPTYKSQLDPNKPYITQIGLGESRVSVTKLSMGKAHGRLLKPSEIAYTPSTPKQGDFNRLTWIPLGKSSKYSYFEGGTPTLLTGKPPPPPDDTIQLGGKPLTANDIDRFLSKGGTKYDSEMTFIQFKGSPVKSTTSKPQDYRPLRKGGQPSLKLKPVEITKTIIKTESPIKLMSPKEKFTSTKINLGESKNVLVLRNGQITKNTLATTKTPQPFLISSSKQESKSSALIKTGQLQQQKQTIITKQPTATKQPVIAITSQPTKTRPSVIVTTQPAIKRPSIIVTTTPATKQPSLTLQKLVEVPPIPPASPFSFPKPSPRGSSGFTLLGETKQFFGNVPQDSIIGIFGKRKEITYSEGPALFLSSINKGKKGRKQKDTSFSIFGTQKGNISILSSSKSDKPSKNKKIKEPNLNLFGGSKRSSISLFSKSKGGIKF